MFKLSYTAPVVYLQPAYTDLKGIFDWVSVSFMSAAFKPVDVCKGVSTENREITFELVFPSDSARTTREILAELDRHGLRPALYEELLSFTTKFPNLSKNYPVIALGSVWRRFDRLCSPCVYWSCGEQRLSFDWINNGNHERAYFLAVRK